MVYVHAVDKSDTAEAAAIMNEQPRYSMIIEWSDEDQVYIVTLPEWGPYAKTHGDTYSAAVRNGEEALELLIASAIDAHETLPEPNKFAFAQ